ncbi:hypothetical protein ASD46_25230 [Rhizobium sp. Root491]|uniref:SLATT domain-containing protein n=1 Tax=Rhizobium/Agrobacterium group TaxID=227290 RepID=UPI000715D828|nr:SLATT domain-containing protein [Rhizobium sp. Root491]KQY49261.1 hypothetical protein ASD46_25230 [Rhizobium sp. Root491]
MGVVEVAQESARDKLLKDMKQTKGVRFNAAKRIEESDRKRTANTAYASVAVVVLTLLPVFFPMQQWIESAISLTTVALSIFILASSLLQSSHAGQVKADQFHRCALEINSLRRELLTAVIIDGSTIPLFSNRYDEILRRYNINHDAVDYDKYRLEHPDEFPSLAKKDNDISRKSVSKNDRLVDALGRIIVATTAILTAAAIASPLFQEILTKYLTKS